jgi:hypothetical protein
MLIRVVPGVLLIVIGAVWIAQGLDVLKGSAMTGHGQYALLGAVTAAAGIALVAWGVVVRNRDT